VQGEIEVRNDWEGEVGDRNGAMRIICGVRFNEGELEGGRKSGWATLVYKWGGCDVCGFR
jgi:hypothetical protein